MTTLTVDIRTPYQFKKVEQILQNGFLKDYEKVVFVLPYSINKHSFLESYGMVIKYHFNPARYVLFLFYLYFLLTKKAPVGNCDILTAVNHGPFYKSLTIFSRGKTILYEDGISTFLKLKKISKISFSNASGGKSYASTQKLLICIKW